MVQPGSSEEKGSWYLEDVSNDTAHWLAPIEPIPFLIGRDPDCSLRLQSRWASRRHAEIRTSGVMLWIRDLGSTNGTYVNNRKIAEAELLESGDVLTFGRSEFCIRNIDNVIPSTLESTCSFESVQDLCRLSSYEALLLQLLEERKVVPHFQPILEFCSLKVIGYEVLARVQCVELPEEPAELFSVATHLGCAARLSSLFREVGVSLGRGLPGNPLIFLNALPAEMIHMDALLESIKGIREMALPGQLVLEIHEKAVTDAKKMKRFRSALTDLTVGLAFDDFGVGQMRLKELAEAPPDYLKFDMTLIRHIHLSPRRLQQMVHTFVKAARDLGIATLAEGIECAEESETCRQIGFEYAQGYLYGKPQPLEAALSVGPSPAPA